MSVSSSELTVRRPGRPRRAVPCVSAGHATTRSPLVQLEHPPTNDGSGSGPRAHPRANPFPGYGSILPTSLAYIVPSTRGCSPWRPDAVMSTTGRERHSVLRIFKGAGRTDTTRRGGALPTWTLPPPSRFCGGQFSFEYLLLPPRSAPTAAPPRLTPKVLQRPLRPPTHRGLALAPTASGPSTTGSPSLAPLPGTWARSVAEDASPDYNSNNEIARFSSWAIPGSLAVTRGILVSTMILPQVHLWKPCYDFSFL
ncbi:hypothetical protein RHMOL_RhmolUnG0010500 [Rhododendron molle]|nr:hypothetical protein RHMOL_RhmolUnG0010500 [Rhododendron molle]